MSIYGRLGLNFNTAKFGAAANLSQEASNTLNLITQSTGGKLKDWQVNVLNSGSLNRNDLYVNRANTFIQVMLANTNNIYINANTTNNFTLRDIANTLIIQLNEFKYHTDNISGVAVNTETAAGANVAVNVPTLSSAENIGQLNMMTLAKTDGVQNTSAILGSFTSLFIQDELSANANTIASYDKQFAGSINLVDDGMGNFSYTSNLSNAQIAVIESYLSNTQNLIYERRMGDWNFYANSVKLSEDMQLVQEFDSMGGTMTYLVQNVVGTANLKSYISS